MPPPPPPQPEDPEWELPKLRASFGFEDDFKYLANDQLLDQVEADTEFFDVKFYPYSPEGGSTVFAAVSKKHVVVCRLSHPRDKESDPCEIIEVIRDDDDGALNCSCCWTKDAETERPLLCVAGRDAKIKVYHIMEASLHMTLVGHGGEINDLATSPANPRVIASASDDTTVRIWSLDPVHAQQPCICLLGGEGHSWNLLSVSFHETGRYILSAGHDQVINLWTLPDLPTEHVAVPIVVHYPHFSTSEVHSGLVDCVAFFGDWILSRACHEDMIVLWRIEGFSSEDPVPTPAQAPTTYDPSRLTRSAFAPVVSPACPAQYTRLLQFATPHCGPQFFMRFSMYQAAGRHPVLAFCNASSKIMFWDMARLTSYYGFITATQDPDRDKAVPLARPSWLKPIQHRNRVDAAKGGGDAVSKLRDVSDKDSLASGGGGGGGGWGQTATPDPEKAQEYSAETIASWETKHNMCDPHGVIKAHGEEIVGRKNKDERGAGKRKKVPLTFVGRQVAWSRGGEWCVVVGSQNLAVILQRWAP